MATAVVICMKSLQRLFVATASQLAMGENGGNGVCVEHTSGAEGYRGICHSQQTGPLQCLKFLTEVVDNVSPECIPISFAIDLQRGELPSGMKQPEIA